MDARLTLGLAEQGFGPFPMILDERSCRAATEERNTRSDD
jgi:hypothetical protein